MEVRKDRPCQFRGLRGGREGYRQIGNTLIYFMDNYTIHVQEGTQHAIFHRWISRERGFYKKSWKPFTRALKRRNNLNLHMIYEIALYYEISHAPALHKTKIIPSSKAIKYPSHYVHKKAKRG